MLQSDARQIPLADESVQCVVTSPPYWGLRDYGVSGQIGLESTPEEYVAGMVAVFREVRRVLRDDGTLWLVIGDSYAATSRSSGASMSSTLATRPTAAKTTAQREAGTRRTELGNLKPKDLVGIPWRVAFALQADGWWLRSDIIWAKPNPMPESVTDRPTRSHEYLFLLTKAERYYYDAEAIREPFSDDRMGNPGRYNAGLRFCVTPQGMHGKGVTGKGWDRGVELGGRNRRSVWTIATQPFPDAHFATFPEKLVEPCVLAGSKAAGKRCDCDELIETPTGAVEADDPTMTTGRAGMNRPRGANEGSRPITRREQRDYAEQLRFSPWRPDMESQAGASFAHYIRTDRSGARPPTPELLSRWLALGWLYEPAPCRHPVEGPDLVLDPFCGSGTVGRVCVRLNRSFVGLDLKAEYLEMAGRRVTGVQRELMPLEQSAGASDPGAR